MTAERSRTPVIRAVRAAGHLYDAGASTDLFDLVSVQNEVHPDFAARAAIWRDQRAGLISVAEAQRRSAAVGIVQPILKLVSNSPAARPRHSRPEPNASRQYAPAMATTAARDDRLTPNAKSLLQVIRARCGKGAKTITTRATLAAIMSRSVRTIVRYLRDLEAFGYIRSEIHRNGRGLHLGLAITVEGKTAPFFEDHGALAKWLSETPEALLRPFTGRVLAGKDGVSKLRPKNHRPNISILDRWKRVFREGGVASAVPT